MDSGRSSGPVARGRARLGREIGAKVTVWLGLAVGICVPYFGLQRVHLFPLRSVPATPLDALVAFDPAWVWAYASLALLVPLGPLLATRREELVRYAIGLAWLCAACFVVFLFFPVEGPRPATLPDDPLYRFVVSQDRPSNSLPSLHAGLTLYSFLFCWRVFVFSRFFLVFPRFCFFFVLKCKRRLIQNGYLLTKNLYNFGRCFLVIFQNDLGFPVGF